MHLHVRGVDGAEWVYCWNHLPAQVWMYPCWLPGCICVVCVHGRNGHVIKEAGVVS